MFMNRRVKGILLMLANTFIWGIAPVVIKASFSQIPPIPFLLYRFIWVVGLMLPVGLIYGFHIKYYVRHRKLIWLAFLQNAVVLLLLFLGIQYTSASLASVITALVPLLAMYIASRRLHEHVNHDEKIGVILTFLGFLGMIYVTFNLGEGNHLLGLTLITLGNVIFLYSVLDLKAYFNKVRRKPKGFDFSFNFLSFLLALATFAVVIVIFYPDWINVHNLTLGLFNWGVIFMAIFSSIVAMVGYNIALKYLEVSEVTYFTYLQPLIAVPAAYLWLDEKVPVIPTLIFSFMMLLGLYINLKGVMREKSVR